ncbi:hypothetical protein GCM10020369_61150 [Cryptosporangium minutisporangium]|uniref:Uncharacterized protein n=1 Tax=Cryptosporangium minutisporangium TaxID=113569 RepID=A0ABP6T5Q5_9ACTN
MLLGAGDCGENSDPSLRTPTAPKKEAADAPSPPGAPFRRTVGVRSAPQHGEGRHHIDGAATIDVGCTEAHPEKQQGLPYPQQGQRFDGGEE